MRHTLQATGIVKGRCQTDCTGWGSGDVGYWAGSGDVGGGEDTSIRGDLAAGGGGSKTDD